MNSRALLPVVSALALGAAIAAALAADIQPANDAGWTPLFDGKSLDGFTREGGKANYEVVDGTIVGRPVKGTPNTFLATDKEYGDFELEFEVMASPEMNSGVQIRSHIYDEDKTYEWNGKKIKVGKGRFHGYQVELEHEKNSRGWWCGIYDEGRRGWLYPGSGGGDREKFGAEGEKLWRNGEWNSVRVLAEGDRIRTWLNGELRADLTDSLTPSGRIGLQVHSIGNSDPGDRKVAWRNLRIRSLD